MPNLKERKAFSFPWINPGVSKGRHLMIETVPAGTVLHGRYRIERVLGSGGFGHVYLAIDLATNQQCAVKEYLVTGTNGQEQLQHEASVLSHLHHPNLPAFQNAFTERDRYYIVLNYIEGNDLTDLIRMARQHNEVVPIRQIIAWLLAVCDAVMFLHRQEPIVIHRDIKPDNIRITPLGTAILVDMGNAKAAADGVRTLSLSATKARQAMHHQNNIPAAVEPMLVRISMRWEGRSILRSLPMNHPVSRYAISLCSKDALHCLHYKNALRTIHLQYLRIPMLLPSLGRESRSPVNPCNIIHGT